MFSTRKDGGKAGPCYPKRAEIAPDLISDTILPMNQTDATVEELKQRLDQGESLFLLDVRNPEEEALCRIPGGTLLPLAELPARWRELEPGREIIVYCRSGARSQRAVLFLRQQGFAHVRNLQGGILAWADRIDPSVPKY